MRLKIFLSLALSVSLASGVLAADPWVGSWTLELGRSTFDPGPPPKSVTIQIASRPADGLWVVTNGVDAQGHAIHTERTARFDGTDYPAQGFQQPTTQAFTRVDARSYRIVSKAGGRVITRTTVTILDDGKTMRTVTEGQLDQGPIHNVQVFQRASNSTSRH